MHYLTWRAHHHGIELDLGREEGIRESKGKSYSTYGRIMYKPPGCKLRGRIHIDRELSFMYTEGGGMHGLIDLSRLSPGSAISAMQVNEAIRTGHLVMWKKKMPEDFKTAKELIVSDRGSFIHTPSIGVHDSVTELDFCSLYPHIIVMYNISPETLNCECCPHSTIRVPGL